jgi:hypothetical protein
LNNEDTTCSNTVNLDFGATNYSNSSGSVDEVVLTFTTSFIKNGNYEMLIPSGSSGGLSDTIGLAFSTNSNENFTLGGLVYQAQKSVSAGVSTIKFDKNGGGKLTTAQTETLLDALQFQNTDSSKTAGVRTFDIKACEVSFFSPIATYNVTVDCAAPPPPPPIMLSIMLHNFEGKSHIEKILLNWTTSFEGNNCGFFVERSYDAITFYNMNEQNIDVHFINQFGSVASQESISIKQGMINSPFSISRFMPGQYYIKLFADIPKTKLVKSFIVY